MKITDAQLHMEVIDHGNLQVDRIMKIDRSGSNKFRKKERRIKKTRTDLVTGTR